MAASPRWVCLWHLIIKQLKAKLTRRNTTSSHSHCGEWQAASIALLIDLYMKQARRYCSRSRLCHCIFISSWQSTAEYCKSSSGCPPHIGNQSRNVFLSKTFYICITLYQLHCKHCQKWSLQCTHPDPDMRH